MDNGLFVAQYFLTVVVDTVNQIALGSIYVLWSERLLFKSKHLRDVRNANRVRVRGAERR